MRPRLGGSGGATRSYIPELDARKVNVRLELLP